MGWIDRARWDAKEYRSNCIELRRLKELRMLPASSERVPVKGGKISKPVEVAVEQSESVAREAYLQRSVDAVQYAMEQVLKKPQGELTIKLFDMIYYNRSHTLYGAAQVLHLTERTAKRYNRYFLKMIAERLGYIESIKFSEKMALF
ncbi:hypothetical protein D1157_06030 [Anaerotruncus sp. X29]|nr:hypothetical protein [Anaerotruncus sp. X29]